MSVPISIKKSAISLPQGKAFMSCVTWRDGIILFDLYSSKIVYHHSGKWTSKETMGDAPIYANEELAQVANDKMYLLDYDNTMHALNLHSWTWLQSPQEATYTQVGLPL